MNKSFSVAMLVVLAVLIHGLGLTWGLPSKERTRLVLADLIEPDDFFNKLAKGRARLREIMAGKEPTALEKADGLIKGRGFEPFRLRGKTFESSGKVIPGPLLTAYGSFLIRLRHNEEASVISGLSQINPLKKISSPVSPLNYGALYLYPMGAILFVFQKFGLIKIESDLAYYYSHPEEIRKVYILLRVFNSFLSFLILPALYFAGRNIFNTKVAIWTLFFWVTTPIHIYFAHIIKPHLISAAFGFLVIYFACKILEQQTHTYQWHWKAGFFMGIGMGIGANILPCGLIVVAAHVWRYSRRLFSKISLKQLACFVGGVALMVPFGYPWLFTDLSAWIENMQSASSHLHIVPVSEWLLNFPLVLGWPLALLVVFGVLEVLREMNLTHRFLAVSMLVYLLFGFFHDARFFIPTFMGLTLLAANVVAKYSLNHYGTKSLVIGSLLIMSCFLPAAGQVWNLHEESSTRSLSVETGRWINNTVPAGSSLGLQEFPTVDFTPPFTFGRFKIMIGGLGDFRGQEPDYYVLTREDGFISKPKYPSTSKSDFLSRYRRIEECNVPWKSLSPFLNPFVSANHPFWIYQKKS